MAKRRGQALLATIMLLVAGCGAGVEGTAVRPATSVTVDGTDPSSVTVEDLCDVVAAVATAERLDGEPQAARSVPDGDGDRIYCSVETEPEGPETNGSILTVGLNPTGISAAKYSLEELTALTNIGDICSKGFQAEEIHATTYTAVIAVCAGFLEISAVPGKGTTEVTAFGYYQDAVVSMSIYRLEDPHPLSFQDARDIFVEVFDRFGR